MTSESPISPAAINLAKHITSHMTMLMAIANATGGMVAVDHAAVRHATELLAIQIELTLTQERLRALSPVSLRSIAPGAGTCAPCPAPS